jgi:hypothetical protein
MSPGQRPDKPVSGTKPCQSNNSSGSTGEQSPAGTATLLGSRTGMLGHILGEIHPCGHDSWHGCRPRIPRRRSTSLAATIGGSRTPASGRTEALFFRDLYVPQNNMICVVVDRLHAGMLGAYGNSWIHTDHFDQWASGSFAFDQAYLESPRLDSLYQAYWLGLRAARHREGRGDGQSFARIVGRAGWHTALVTDEPELIGFAPASDFAERRLVDAPDLKRAADDVSQTGLARLFTTVTDWLVAPREPFCLWVHARAMGGAWDAPLPLRNQYADEEDPTPSECVEVPDRRLSEDYDPDELLRVVHAYAGQVTLLDACLGALLAHLEETGLAATTQSTLLSARGFPLGEHQRIGTCDEALYNESVQIPWLMRFPDGTGALARSQALVQPSDLPGTLLDWLGLVSDELPGAPAVSLLPIVRGQKSSTRDQIRMVSAHDRAIRTPAWFLRTGEHGPAELYTKPSDRWEKNEVARLCGNVVSGLENALAESGQAGQDGERPPLADILVTEVD